MSNAYGYQPQAAPPQKSGGALKVILIILGVLLVLCCGGVGITAYVAYSGVKTLMVEGAKEAIKTSPEAQAALGDIQSVSIDTKASGEQDTLVANITGSKGNGTITLAKDGKSAELKMSDGKIITIPIHTEQNTSNSSDSETTIENEADATEEAEAPAPTP